MRKKNNITTEESDGEKEMATYLSTLARDEAADMGWLKRTESNRTSPSGWLER